MARGTGFPTSDAQDDFLRARRRRALARMSAALGLKYDVEVMLAFDGVVEALGRVGERDLGTQTIALESVVGSFDRRRTSTASSDRPSRACAGVSSGSPTRSGAGRRCPRTTSTASARCTSSATDTTASRSRAQGRETIDARVVEVLTRVPADAPISASDLPLKSHERVFHERAPARFRVPRADRAERPDALREAGRGR